MPSGLLRVDAAFEECVNLRKIVLPEGLNTIGYEAFRNCIALEYINIPDSVSYIADYAFEACMSLKEIALPDNGYISIGYGVFYRCHKLNKVDLGSLVSIKNNTFADCIRLTEIEIPSTVSYIGKAAFKNCIRLNNITIYNPDCTIESYIDTIPENANITGYDYSTAESYADDWMRSFTVIGGNHMHRYKSKITVSATCDKSGVKTYTCPCGDSYTETISPTGHSMNNGVCRTCGYKEIVNCNCRCHKGVLSRIWFNIILFFQRIFRTNKYCACGAAHY